MLNVTVVPGCAIRNYTLCFADQPSMIMTNSYDVVLKSSLVGMLIDFAYPSKNRAALGNLNRLAPGEPWTHEFYKNVFVIQMLIPLSAYASLGAVRYDWLDIMLTTS
jgi:hypothetical protein